MQDVMTPAGKMGKNDPMPTQMPSADAEPSHAFRLFSLAARLVLGVILLTAGAEKLATFDQFTHSIYNYQMLPMELLNIAALLFIWAEVTVGLLLLAGAAVRGAALISGTLMLVFIIAIASAMARGLEIDCGCFAPTEGSEPEKVGWPKVFEDVGLMALSIYLIYFPRSYFSLDELRRKQARTGER